MTKQAVNPKITSEKLGMHRALHKIQGNKFRLLPEISDVLSENIFSSDSIWVEPFMGTGVVGFNLAPENAYFYDINPHIVMLYKQIKQRKITLKSMTNALFYYQKKFKELKAPFYYELRRNFNENPNPMDFLILNRVSYNGIIRFSQKEKNFNIPYCNDDLKLTDTLIDELLRVFALLSYKIKHNNWHFNVGDFQTGIQTHKNDENALFFCDPPYIGRNTQYFTSWEIENEECLFNLISSIKGHFLLTTWYGEYDIGTNEPKNIILTDSSSNPSFTKHWATFKNKTFSHKYIVAGSGAKRVGVYESIVYK